MQWSTRVDIDELLYFCNRYLEPLFFFLLALSLHRNRRTPFLNWSAALYFLSITASSVANQKYKSLFLAVDFLLISYVLVWIGQVDDLGNYFLRFSAGIFIWMVLPFMSIFTTAFGHWREFFSESDFSYHGFSDSRIFFGLVASIAAIYAFSVQIQSRIIAACIIGLVLGSLYLTQSRAAVFSAAVALAYTTSNSKKFGSRTLMSNLFYYLLFAVVISGSWKLFGRHEPLALSDPNRNAIAANYFDIILNSNILLGAGEMVNINMPDGSITQAHNLLVQWLLNWGILGAAALVYYLYDFARRLYSREAKAVLLALVLYSLFQPIQGTANIFSPVTLWIILLIILSDSYLKGRNHQIVLANASPGR